jgi:hypothetical protein
VPPPPSIDASDDDLSNIVQLDGLDDTLSSGGSINSDPPQPIPVIQTNRQFSDRPRNWPRNKIRPRNIRTIKRSNKQLEALLLPTVININPRSIYNKLDEFHTLVQDLDVDLVCMSESWERENLRLEEVIQLDNYQTISNVHQRTGKGGRPAIIVNESRYHVQNLTNTVISIPYGVEVTWALLTPKEVSANSIVKKIAVASIYCKPDSRKKTLLLDHIAEAFHTLSSKYQSGLYFLMAGDTNDLKLDSILSLSPTLKQVVESPTRLNPPRILDPIITSLSIFYQQPICLPPLDNDPDKDGSPSDHMIVYMKPIDSINNNPARKKVAVKFRPLTDSGIRLLGQWLQNQTWENISSVHSAHDKAEILQNVLMEQINCFLPEKTVRFTSDDHPWTTSEIKDIARRKKREFFKRRKSIKWKRLNKLLETKCETAKLNYYTNIVSDLKSSNPGQWYSKLKRMSSYDQAKGESVNVGEIMHLSAKDQADAIAENFSKVSNEYEKLRTSDIDLSKATNTNPTPVLEEYQVYEYLRKIKTNTSTVLNDIPAKIIKEFACELAKPLTDVINTMVSLGQYPNIWKIEIVSPVPKVYPTVLLNDLRKIAGLKNFSKIAEKIISKWLISDMSDLRDKSQYGNEKGVSVNHYLIKMIHEILTSVDTNTSNEKFAVICTMIDWKQAFDRQCPKLGVESFMRNGVRKSLVPLLVNYLQDRKMFVKWMGELSDMKELNGGGPQGALWGILEYLSLSNDNTNYINPKDKFKFIDDLSILEKINLLYIGLSSYNYKNNVASDMIKNGYFLPPENLQTQSNLNKISQWTRENKMELNVAKTKAMNFNFTKKFQFSSRLAIDDRVIETISETKLLGVMISNDMSWDSNTQYIVKRANARMRMLHKLVEFSVPVADLINIFILYIRSVLEQSCQVWHSSLTFENMTDIERVQKNALKIILKEEYTTYEHALNTVGLECLVERREKLCLKFAKSTLMNANVRDMFPYNDSITNDVRQRDKFKVTFANTDRLKDSSIPYMQRLLNANP